MSGWSNRFVMLLALAACGDPTGEVVAFSERGTAEPGAEVPVPGDPTRYTLALSEGVTTAEVVRFGRSLYRYAGQHEFAYPVPNGDGDGLVWAVDEAPIDPIVRIQQSPIIDKEGRRWEWIGWAEGGPETWEDTSAEAREGLDLADTMDGAAPGGEVAEEDESWGVPYLARMQTWDMEDCLAGGFFPVAEHGIWDSESRNVSNYGTIHEAATVLVLRRRDMDGDGDLEVGSCTGTVLEDDNGDSTRVLTAAHCVSSDDTNTGVAPVSSMRVCTYGNDDNQASAGCRDVDAILTDGAFHTGTHNTNEDFAIVVVEGPELNVSTRFALSGATPATWDTRTVLRNSHDGFFAGTPTDCVRNDIPEAVPLYSGTVGLGMVLYRQSHLDEDFYSTSQIRTTFDSAGGSSGSAYYYCPSNCDTATSAIIGLHTTWDSFLNRMKGPRVGEFSTFVTNSL